jgi:hypothetical protein
MRKLKMLILSGLLFSSTLLFSQGCLPEGIFFSSQEEIDNFQTNYPGCTEIEGDVVISNYNYPKIGNVTAFMA